MEARNHGLQEHQRSPPHDTTQTLNPQPPATAQTTPAAAAVASPEQQNSAADKKRKLDTTGFQDSIYFKLRVIVRDLRPYFVQVLHASKFRDCKAVHDIRKQMKIMLELSKQLRVETATHVQERTDSRVGKPTEQNKLNTDMEKTSQADSIPRDSGVLHKTPESEKPSNPLEHTPKATEVAIFGAKKIEQELQGIKGSYIVGGSPLGWNFLIYASGEAVYYGVTKETWFSKQRLKSNSQDP